MLLVLAAELLARAYELGFSIHSNFDIYKKGCKFFIVDKRKANLSLSISVK